MGSNNHVLGRLDMEKTANLDRPYQRPCPEDHDEPR